MRVAVVLLCALAPAARAGIPDGAFARVEGTQFVVEGRPFAFVGANLAALQGEHNREMAGATVEALARDGLRVGRVWAFGEGPADASEWYRRDHLFRAGPDGFIEESYRALDRLLVAARAAGVRLIVTLANQWPDYGGMPMYLRWAGLPAGDVASFYRDERVRGWFRDGVAKLLGRVNHLTGQRYVDDPTIFSWELTNESTVDTPDEAAARRAWIAEMARFIKERDPNHLVAAGLGGYQTRADRAEWIRVHRLPEIDYCDSHLYPQTTDTARSWRRLRDFLDDRAQLAHHVIRKPLVIGEFGFHTSGDDGERWLGAPRATWFARVLDRLALDGAAGALVWIYEPFAGRPRDFGIYVDRPDTDDVRRVLALRAAHATATEPREANPRLSDAGGARPLYDPVITVGGPARRPHDGWLARDGGERVLEIPPEEFVDARFERAGVWDRTALAHVYGSGPGRFRYRFAAPVGMRAPSRVVIRARVSSEWPGTTKAPADGGSRVDVLLDGARVATVEAIPDDGAGTMQEIALHDPKLLRRLAHGDHWLAFAVADRADNHGVCIYGAPTGRGRPPVGEAAPIQVLYQPAETLAASR